MKESKIKIKLQGSSSGNLYKNQVSVREFNNNCPIVSKVKIKSLHIKKTDRNPPEEQEPVLKSIEDISKLHDDKVEPDFMDNNTDSMSKKRTRWITRSISKSPSRVSAASPQRQVFESLTANGKRVRMIKVVRKKDRSSSGNGVDFQQTQDSILNRTVDIRNVNPLHDFDKPGQQDC